MSPGRKALDFFILPHHLRRDLEFYGCVPDTGAPRTREHQYSGPLLGHHEILTTADGETFFSWPWTQLA